MIVELGQVAIILALLVAIAQFALPMIGSYTGNQRWMALAIPATFLQFVLVTLALIALVIAFLQADFSVAYVASHSNLQLPWYYRITAVWSSHEGSFLLWIVILNVWSFALALFSKQLDPVFRARVLSILGFISIGFLGFLIFTSNPFLRHIPGLADGNDMNPLLQDFGMIIHPPMLYMGYVGFAVAFSFAIAALLDGKVDSRWVRWSRPWTNIAWSFLTLGIALGSWWAYYELGWGGWWFWDPVENASFMPWLVGTALIHSQAITDKRGGFRGWTVLLAIAAFSLSLLGTFLVRSGILTSVHSFASDPERGLYILIFFGIVTGGALLLYAIRAPRLGTANKPFAVISRESLILVNNLLLTSACAMVLLGTLYPLLIDALGLGKISVGPPYFGLLFTLLMIPIFILVPFGPFSRWQKDESSRLFQPLKFAIITAVIAATVWTVLAHAASPKLFFGVLAGVWVLAGTSRFVWNLARDASKRAALRSGEILGMVLAHAGLGVFVIGVMLVESSSIEKDIRMIPGESIQIADYDVHFERMEKRDGPNFKADHGVFVISKNGEMVATLEPEKRLYLRGQVMTEAALDPGLTRDLYIALGEPMNAEDAWAVRVYHKPFIRFIWLGALLMMAGGFIAAGDKRLKLRAAQAAIEPV